MITTIVEQEHKDGHKTIEIRNSEGFSGSLVYENNEAIITINYPGENNEYDQWNVHPVDAYTEFLAQFLKF